MEGLIIFILYAGIPALGLLGAFLAGNWIASRHDDDLTQRARAVADIRMTDMKLLIDPVNGPQPPSLMVSEVTLGIDHFRGFLGNLKNIFGGEVRSYQTTLERARREVIMRLLEQAHAQGFNAVANLRINFVDISGNATKARKASSVSIIASATAHYAATGARAQVSRPIPAAIGP